MQFSQDKKVRVRSVRSTPAAVTRPGKPGKLELKSNRKLYLPLAEEKAIR